VTSPPSSPQTLSARQDADPPRWRPLAAFDGWSAAAIPADALAGLTLAAIAVPEQMATASLGGFAEPVGLVALVAGAVGFALLGANRRLSVGADSTITPIFAGALAVLASTSPAHYGAVAALLALLVGLTLLSAGAFRLGFVADLLSIPVITGFLAGVSLQIVVSQAPAILGVDPPPGTTIEKVAALAAAARGANLFTLALGLGVFAVTALSERLSARLPGALIGLIVATALTAAFRLETHGVATLGRISGASLSFGLPDFSVADLLLAAPLALIVATVVMVQTAATTRGFVSDPSRGPEVDQDFLGLGAANVVAGLIGAFPVNASPPRTAILAEIGSQSQLASLIAAAIALALATAGAGLLASTPHAALAGVLLFVAARIFRVAAMADVWRRSRPEFALIVATIAAIVVLPIEEGVGIGIVLSLLHGVWTVTRARTVEFKRIPGTSIWWPASALGQGEVVEGALVVGLQAPLSFLNAYAFQSAIKRLVGGRPGLKLVVFEANAIVEIDYTGAKILADIVARLRAKGLDVAVARLEAVRAQESLARQGLTTLIGEDHLFHSVAEAVSALAPLKP